MAKKKNNTPHLLDVVKLTFVFAAVAAIFGMIALSSLGYGKLGFADAARGGIKGKPNQTYPTPLPTSVTIACPEIYSPVCGVNGKTYPNGCVAGRSNVEVECNGTCPCGDGDPFEVDPPLVY